jgi:hypothetical protein
VLAAVEDVEHRDGQGPGADPAEIAIERQVVRRGRRVGDRQRHAQDGVRPELAFVRCAVEVDEDLVDAGLVRGVEPEQLRGDPIDDVADSRPDTLAAVPRRVAVAQLDRLVGAGRGAARDGGPPHRAVDQDDVDLDRRIAA